MKAPRKAELIETLERFLRSDGVVRLWTQLKALEQSAVAEAVHSVDGAFDPGAFHAKYGALPAFQIEEENCWQKNPTLLGLFIHPKVTGGRSVPDDLREQLRTFVPKPAAPKLSAFEQIPERPPRKWTSRRFDAEKRGIVYEDHELPLIVRLTEQAALQDLRTVLRLIDQEKISVSSKTLLPSKATMALLNDLLRERDFFERTEKVNSWDPEIGPVKAFSWVLLVQAAKFAALRNEKLLLTKTGRAALETPLPQSLRELWNAWIARGIIDEFSRIDTIKGQKGKGRQSFTPPGHRRLAIKGALAECPVGQWVEIGEFSRYMRAAGFQFEVTRNPWSLYICDAQYGSLGYEGYGGWNILQERYLLCLLFEYAAPLGMIDIAYEHPAGARNDFKGQWGTDDLIFLSRYDGLRYLRLTPLGQFILGRADHYESREEKSAVSLIVLPNRQIRIENGDLSPDQKLLLENFAEPQCSGLWVLDEARAIRSIEKGARVSELRAFLTAGDPQPLPEAVEGFITAVEKRGAACVCKGTALLIECISPQIAEMITHNSETGKLCQRAGERCLVLPVDKEKSFRAALNTIGYGMPQV
ncbi:MAG TPA: hypothetical protein PK256_05395 [Verrucomicrobiota bacterium]|nr:hypothetical protein [Verrucomicrobiota bacterium]